MPSLLRFLENLVALWPLALPLIAGGAAVYLLLPRPRAYPAAWGLLAGVAALVLGGGLLVRAGTVWQETLLFYLFSGVAIAAGAILVTQQNPARAALSFALVVLAVCGLFLLLAAPFLMAATVIVYAGAIVVTFLFVLMLAQPEGLSDADARSREPLLGTITGFVLLAALLFVLQLGHGTRAVDRLTAWARAAAEGETREEIELAVGDPDKVEEVADLARAGALFRETRDILEAHGWGDLHDEARDREAEFNRAATDEAKRAALAGLVKVRDDARARLLRARGVPEPKRKGYLFKETADFLTRNGWSDLRDEDERGAQALSFAFDGAQTVEAKQQVLERLAALTARARLRLGTATPPADLPLSALSGPPANTAPDNLRRDPKTGMPRVPAENSAYLGRSLFTDYLLPVELAGTLLLVATIGAIAIAQRRAPAGPPPPTIGMAEPPAQPTVRDTGVPR